MVKESNKNRADALGDRMKAYEALTTKTTLMPNTPVYARIDGRAFHTLTKGLHKPFDPIFNTIMDATCQQLVEQTGAILGYRQSDEISLGWEDITKAPFEGKLFKLESVLASMTSGLFYKGIMVMTMKANLNELDEVNTESLKVLIEKSMQKPISFDCRIFNVPTMEELANAFLWRENDAVRNSIQSLAQANFSHKELQGKSANELQDMLITQCDVNWNDLPPILKRGVYLQKELFEMELPDEVWDKIPDDKKPESRTVIRSRVVPLELPVMKSVTNKVGAYFYKEEPVVL